MEKQRLSKILAQRGVASRRACEELIFARRVQVNGKVILEPQFHVNPAVDKILVDHQPVKKSSPFLYLLFHKPKGMICSHQRQSNNKLIYDAFAHESARLFSIGRLDKDTSGLLLMTNDGQFSHKVIHPSSNISKEYIVKTGHEITEEHLKTIQNGCFVEGKWTKPLKVTKVRKGTLKVIVQEGRKREVRLLVENADLKILELKRTRIGNLRLGSLQEGCYRPLTEEERTHLFS